MNSLHRFRSVRRSLLVVMATFAAPTIAATSSVSLQIAGLSTSQPSRVAQIIEKRFDSLKPELLDSVSTQLHGSRIDVRFSGWSPSPDQIAYLTHTVGRFRLTLESDTESPLIVESDVADSRPLKGRDRPALAVRLTDAAAARVAAVTRAMVGKDIIVEWERRVIARLRIAGALGRDIALDANTDADALLMSAVLRGGRLPDGVAVIVLWSGQETGESASRSLERTDATPKLACDPKADARKEVRVRHIHIEAFAAGHHPDVHVATPEEEVVAYNSLALARQDLVRGESFEAVLNRYSNPRKSGGDPDGDLGFVKRGRLPAEFDRVAFCIPVGEISPVFRTSFGFHVAQVTDVRY